MQELGAKLNIENLKLRNSYKRYFLWGSKEKPGIKITKTKLPLKFSNSLKLKLAKASTIRKSKIFLILFIFFILLLITGYIVVKM